MLKLVKSLSNAKGFSLVELIIGALIMVLICTFTLQAFLGQNAAQNAQAQVSDAQQSAVFSMAELTKAVRNAGYRVPVGKEPVWVKPGSLSHDTLIIYNQTDSTRFYLAYTGADVAHPKMMRKLNTGAAEVYAEDIEDIDFFRNGKVLTVSITARTAKIDKGLNDYRRRTVSSDILMPNAS